MNVQIKYNLIQVLILNIDCPSVHPPKIFQTGLSQASIIHSPKGLLGTSVQFGLQQQKTPPGTPHLHYKYEMEAI